MTDSSSPAAAHHAADAHSLAPGRAAAAATDASPATRFGRKIPWTRVRHVIVAHAPIAGGYFVAGKLGLMLGLVHPSASAVWAPTGIALAALLLRGAGAWPGIFLGAFLVNITTAGSAGSSLGIATGNTLEALIGAALVNRFAGGRHAFDRPGDSFRFALLAGLLATAVSATIGIASLALTGFAGRAELRSIWLTWWLGDMGGALVVAPLLVVWAGKVRPRRAREHEVEAVALLVILLALGQWVFRASAPAGLEGHPLEFLCMPLLAWAAFRFDQHIATLAIFEISAVAVWGALTGAPTTGRRELNESLVVLQVFTGVTAVTTLALAALVSERRRMDAAVRATTRELHEAMTELEAFSRSITHDLRSPVGAVINYSAFLAQGHAGPLGDEALSVVEQIRASAQSATGLLDQLTQYAWAGREPGERETLDMTALAREVYAELVVGGGDVRDVQFELSPLPRGRGSPELLRCVFRNLLSNAVKYTRGRQQRLIRIAGVAGPVENTYSVTDNGIGFDPALGDTLFEPFRRLSAARAFEGTGLGLAIVDRIMRRQHGRVWAESDGRSGARFCFTLPFGEPTT